MVYVGVLPCLRSADRSSPLPELGPALPRAARLGCGRHVPVQRAHRGLVVGGHPPRPRRRPTKHPLHQPAPGAPEISEQPHVGAGHSGRDCGQIGRPQLAYQVVPALEVGDVREVVKIAQRKPVPDRRRVGSGVGRKVGGVGVGGWARGAAPVDALGQQAVLALPRH
eukprot:scaffold13268_cov122-Isochrysis_galbana.AAC.2